MNEPVTWMWFPDDWPSWQVPQYPTVPVDADSQIEARVVREPRETYFTAPPQPPEQWRRAVRVKAPRRMCDKPPVPIPPVNAPRVMLDRNPLLPTAYLEIAFNGWIGVQPWISNGAGMQRAVIRCQRVDGVYAARVQEAPKA